MNWVEKSVKIDQIHETLFEEKQVKVHLLREDLLHKEISGNKWRKLKYNVLIAQQKKCDALLTFGGAFSNHIAATAAAGKEMEIKTIGIIRGQEADLSNSTLHFAAQCGMEIVRVTREEYNRKAETAYQHALRAQFGNIWIVPEGGANYEGINGCTEILTPEHANYSVIATACGTGSTMAGISLSLKEHQRAIGFSALKAKGYMQNEVKKHLNWFLMDEELADEYLESISFQESYHFGGFGKINDELVAFIQHFWKKHSIELDGLYTGKMLFGIYDLIKNDFFHPGENILVVHTGGLQGNAGLEKRYGVKFH